MAIAQRHAAVTLQTSLLLQQQQTLKQQQTAAGANTKESAGFSTR
jgi:hypothetical protein